MAEIDSLEIRIQAQATKANDAIDKLDDKLERLERALSSLNKVNIANFANGVDKLSKAMVSMNQVKTTDFTRLAKNLANLSTVNVAGLNSSASAVIMLSKAFGQLSTATQNANNIAIFANALSKLGNKSVQNAIINIPRLSYSMRLLFENLSTLPTVNRNIIDMTNALANLASQGSKVGSASNSIVSGLNKTNTAMARTTKQATSLASAFGKFYASYFLIIRGVKNLWKSIESSMDYVETYNYFNVALNKIGEDTASMFGEYGKDSAERYAEEFGNRLNELNKKMTGYIVGDDGALQLVGDMGLGLNIQQLMNFQAKVLSVTNSVGLMGEASTSAAKAVSMLAGDYSSLTNLPVEEVMEKLTSGMLGQSRALYSLGIDITNNTLQQYAYAEGIEKAVSEMTQSEKMQLRLLAILDQSEVAWGDLANTVDSVANQYRVFQMQIKNLGRTFGNLFLPIITNVLPYVNGLVIALNNLFTSLGFSMYGDTWLSDLQDGISGSIQGDVGELEEGLEDADGAAKKLKKSLSSFDELEVLSFGGISSAKDAEGVIDLTKSIADALTEYEIKWNEAFEKAENRASEFADVFAKAFNFTEIENNFGELVSSINDFSDAIKPFTSGFGKGFLDFFGTMADTTLDVFTESLDTLGNVIEKVPASVLEKFGEAFGVLAASVGGFIALNGISTKFKALSDGFALLGKTLKQHPILSTFTVGYGILSFIDSYIFPDAEITESQTAETIASSVKTISDALKEAENEFSEDNALADNIGIIFEEWSKLNEKVGELTSGEKSLLKTYADKLKEYCQEVVPYINEDGTAFENVVYKIEEAIKKVQLYYKTVSHESLLGDLTTAQISLEYDLADSRNKIDELYAYIREKNQDLSDEEIQGLIDVATNTEFKEVFGKMKEGLTSSAIAEIFAFQLGISTKDVEEFTDKVSALKELGELQIVEKETEEELNKVTQRIEDVTKKYLEYKTALEESTKIEETHGTIVEETGSILGNLSSTYLPDVIAKTKELEEQSKESSGEVKELSDSLDSLANKKISIPIHLDVQTNLKDLILNNAFPRMPIMKYSVGGFPEDGLFMANHGELVGKFSNGKTAVANNQQIVDGIKQGVYEAVVSAMGTTKSDSGDVVVNMDGREVFRVVRARANEYYNVNGKAAFNF